MAVRAVTSPSGAGAEESQRGGVMAVRAEDASTQRVDGESQRGVVPARSGLVEGTDALDRRVGFVQQRDAVDHAALEWIARFRFVTADLLGLYLGVNRQNAQKRARRLADEGLLHRAAARPGEAMTLAVTARGMRKIGLPPRRAPRTDVQRDHELALVWLVLRITMS